MLSHYRPLTSTSPLVNPNRVDRSQLIAHRSLASTAAPLGVAAIPRLTSRPYFKPSPDTNNSDTTCFSREWEAKLCLVQGRGSNPQGAALSHKGFRLSLWPRGAKIGRPARQVSP